MKTMAWFLMALCAVVGVALIAGCGGGLTQEQQEKVDQLGKENEHLAAEAIAMAERMRADGTLSPEEALEIAAKLTTLYNQIRSNVETIKSIKDSAPQSGWATFLGILLAGHRTVLHAVQRLLPAAAPWAVWVNVLIGALLGGSATSKPAPKPTS